VAAIVGHCRADPELHRLGDVATALASTGLRISELAGLRATDVDAATNVIRLTDETALAPAKAGEGRRQTKNSRSFPISAELKAVLVHLPASPDGLLFHGPRGGRLKPDTVRNVLVRAVLTPLAKRFPPHPRGPGFKGGRLHSFRHYFTSQCATSGVSELAVMGWLGHQASSMVKHYFHRHDRQAQEQMARVTFVQDTGGAVPPAGSEVGRRPGRRGRSKGP
jgi:integrase